MPLYNQQRIIEEYYQKVKDQYPEISFEKFAETCRFPGYYIKQQIKSGRLHTIMVKYLGKFIVYPARVKQELKTQRNFFEGKKVAEEDYEERRRRYEEFLVRFAEGYNTFELIDDDGQEEAPAPKAK